MKRKDKEIMCGKFLEPVFFFPSCMRPLPPPQFFHAVICDPALNIKLGLWAAGAQTFDWPSSWPAHVLPSRVKELTVDPNRVMEPGRPNVHGMNNMDLLNMEWLSISPQRDDLKLLCEQNVSIFFFSVCLFATGRNLKWSRYLLSYLYIRRLPC